MRRVGPTVDPIPCSECGKLIDPLRAGHVAIFDDRLHYFCSYAECRAAYLAPFGGESAPPRRESRPKRLLPITQAIESALTPVTPADTLPVLGPSGPHPGLVEAIGRSVSSEPLPTDGTPPREGGTLLLLIATIAGSLVVLLALSGTDRLVLAARAMLALVGVGMLTARWVTVPREASDPHPIPLLTGPALATLVAAWGIASADPVIASESATLAGFVVVGAALGTWIVEAARSLVFAERSAIEQALDAPSRLDPNANEEAVSPEPVYDLRPGEAIAVHDGETIPADIVMTSDDADVLPWLGATTPSRKRAGDTIVAGAHVLRGVVLGRATWTGLDRAFARILLDPRRRADALAPVARAGRSLAERWSFAASLSAGLSAYFLHHSPVEVAMVVAAVQAGLASAAVGALASVYITRGILLSLRRGITYKSADAWERAARIEAAVFCARGTILLGEPEVAEIEPMQQGIEVNDVLGLAAAAERTESHPVAHAIVRAAHTRKLPPEAVRNPTSHLGLGVVAVTSTGEELSVGNRTLLLEQRISIASAEGRMVELESMGRTVVLVALGGRLAGLIALQDGLRAGARAGVQHLLDGQIEPILMSGDARETCEAIARSLDIEHIRPEVPPDARRDEVRRIADNGVSVAVIGRPTVDADALSAADVSIALGAAGSADGEYEIALASEDVRDAALALALAKRTRTEARVGFGIAALPPVLGGFVVAMGILPPTFVPIAALIGATTGALHNRLLDRQRTPPPSELPRI